MAIEYSDLIVLTGAGSSKACGLPDMRQFAKDFYASLRAETVDDFGRELVCRLIYGLPFIKGNPEPKSDLETLLDGLTRLGEGLGGTCATTTALLSIASEMSNELSTSLHNLVQKAENLMKRAEDESTHLRADMEPNSIKLGQLDVGDISLNNAGVLPDFSALYLNAEDSVGHLGAGDSVGRMHITGDISKYDIEVIRDMLKSARSIARMRNNNLKELSSVAGALSLRVKERIRDAYASPSFPYIQRTWGPTFKTLSKFEPKTIDFFSLNYDPVIEMFCKSNKLGITCGFVPQGQEFIWGDDFTFQTANGSQLVRLYKMHGSITWKGFENRVIEVPLLAPGVIKDLSGQPAKDMMIYPVTGKVFYSEPYFTLINHFRQALLRTRCCLIIGFSYRDELIVDLLRFACRENNAIKFVHCGMSKGKFNRIKHLGEVCSRTEFTTHKFGAPKFSSELNEILTRQLGN